MAKNFIYGLYNNMVKITKLEINTLNNDFYRFRSRIIQSRKQDNTYFVSKMSAFEKKYKKAGLEINFAREIFSFAEILREKGIKDLPGIIYSSLAKMPFLNIQLKEQYALKGLEYAQEQGDSIHTLARLVDLEKIYKYKGNTHNYVAVLFQQEKILDSICKNFKDAKSNYRTYSRQNSSIDKYEIELAKTRVDIAKVIIKSNPRLAKILLERACKVFKHTNRQKEVDFVNSMLAEIHNINL